MKKNILILLLLINTVTFAEDKEQEDRWDLYQFKIYFENDLFGVATDSQYTSGEKFNLTYKVNNPTNFLYDTLISNEKETDIFLTFSIVNQLYTPVDIKETELIEDDRPYAGWTYFHTAMHKSSKNRLNSVSLKVGTIGPASYGEQIQNGIHTLIGVGLAHGWDNQLNNELGINLGYDYKFRYAPSLAFGWLQSAFVPYFEADLGNISTRASLGISVRVGYNIPKDFGLATLDNGVDSSIPVYKEQMQSLKKDFSFSLNFAASGSAVARDIFLDGNTFSASHSLEKNPFVAYASAGVSIRYKEVSVDFINTMNTKKAKNTEGYNQTVGTVIASWQF